MLQTQFVVPVCVLAYTLALALDCALAFTLALALACVLLAAGLIPLLA